MGGRDYRHREEKKQKKEARGTIKVEALTPSQETEVVKKGKARKDRELET